MAEMRIGRVRLSFAIFLVAISIHAYQSEAEDAEPDPNYAKTGAAQKPAPATPPPGTGIEQGDPKPDRRQGQNQKDSAGESRRILLERLIDPITWFTLGLFFVGLAQWRALRRQVDAMIEQLGIAAKSADAAQQSVEAMQASTAIAEAALAHARETAAAQLEETRRANALALRAWLVVETVDIGRLSPYATVTVKARNYGKIPAIKVRALYNFIPAPEYPFPEPLGSDDEPTFPITVGAGLEHTFHFFIPGTIDQEAIDEVERRDAILMLTARFRYTDALNTRGDTGYTGFYTTTSGTKDGPQFVAWFSGCHIR